MNNSQYYLEFKDNIVDRIKSNTFYSYLIHELYDSSITLPEQVLEIEKSINESFLENEEYKEEYDDIARLLNASRNSIERSLQNPEKASIIVGALRDKLEEIEDMELRSQAREKGFFATIIYTIKKALAWIKRTFLDLKDSILDTVRYDKRMQYVAQTRRDFDWIHDYNKRSLARHTSWYDPRREKAIKDYIQTI